MVTVLGGINLGDHQPAEDVLLTGKDQLRKKAWPSECLTPSCRAHSSAPL